jgi:hypothetical protein
MNILKEACMKKIVLCLFLLAAVSFSATHTSYLTVIVIDTTVLIQNIWTASGKTYEASYLDTGDSFYIDRDYRLDSIPQAYQGALWIKTAMEDKASSVDPFLTYQTSKDLRVYVGISTLVTTPGWISGSGWVDSGDEIVVSILNEDVHYKLYYKDFTAGSQVSIGPNSDSDNKQMYIVLNMTDDPGTIEDSQVPAGLFELTLHPNPFQMKSRLALHCKLPVKNFSIEIFNVSGRMIAGFKGLNNNYFEIDASKWPAGVFLVKLNADNRVHYRRITLVR